MVPQPASLRDDASKAAGVPLFYAALQVCHDEGLGEHGEDGYVGCL